MGRYILRFKGQGAMPEADLTRIRSASDVTVLDHASSRMLLVEASAQAVGRLAESLTDWTHSPERTIPLPDTRQTLRSS